MIDVPVVVLLAVTVPSVPMVATVVVTLLQVPPVVASVSKVDAPSHREKIPLMAAGWVLTVTITVDTQLPIV